MWSQDPGVNRNKEVPELVKFPSTRARKLDTQEGVLSSVAHVLQATPQLGNQFLSGNHAKNRNTGPLCLPLGVVEQVCTGPGNSFQGRDLVKDSNGDPLSSPRRDRVGACAVQRPFFLPGLYKVQ